MTKRNKGNFSDARFGTLPSGKPNRHRLNKSGIIPLQYPEPRKEMTQEEKKIYRDKHNIAVYEAMLQGQSVYREEA